MLNNRSVREYLLLLVCLVLAGGSVWLWARMGRAHSYPDAPQGKFACLSYTPRSDSTHSAPGTTSTQIERDLTQLATRTRCVRTYSVANGLDQVPSIARRLGLRVLLGLWIGSNEITNEQELTQGIAIANANRDVIDAIIVGNEVLLRREQTAQALSAMLQQVHAATQLPVTYADVWDFWIKNPQLATATSFVTIHILPYWEDQPVGIDAALAHVQVIYRKIQDKFPGQRIYVGETGWPSAGRQREAAVPSLLNQARFTREFITYASTHDLPYNFIEAYDQPWKRGLEGTVGGYWGLYDARGREKFPLTGSIVVDPQWWRGPLSGAVVAILLTLLAWRINRGLPEAQLTRVQLVACLLLSCFFGAVLMMQWDYLWLANRNWAEWLASCAWALCCDLIFVLALLRLEIKMKWRAGLQFALLFGLAYINLGLVFDARYRDFPSVFLILPVSALLLRGGLGQTHAHTIGAPSAEQTLFASWSLLSALAIAVNEGWRNTHALVWCGLCVLLAVANLPRRTKAQIQQRT